VSVRWVLGPAGVGKTRFCLEGLREAERGGRAAAWLVPEQFTYAADREILSQPELLGLRHVQVLSFSRLAASLRERAGQAPPLTMDEATRPMLLRRVASELPADALGPLLTQRGRPGFLRELSRCVAEIRRHGVTRFAEGIERGRAGIDDPSVARKIEAIAVVYEAYATRLREIGRRDPEEELSDAPSLISANPTWVRGLEVYVDGFVSWTRQERELLIALARAGAKLEITLCLDPEDEARACFRAPAASRVTVEREFEKAGVGMEAAVVLGRGELGRFRTWSQRRLERGVFESGGGQEVRPEDRSDYLDRSDCLHDFLVARSVSEEVLAWARVIDERIRLAAPPLRPREIAVILRNVEPYRSAIERTFHRFDIPYFLDEKRSALAEPHARLLLGAFEVILAGWRRDAVIAWLRDPLLGWEPAVVDLLENLSLEHGLDFESWHAKHWRVGEPPVRAKVASGIERDEALERAGEREEEESSSTGETGETRDDDADFLEEAEEPSDSTADRRVDAQGADRRVSIVDAARRELLGRLHAFEVSWPSEGLPAAEAVAAVQSLLTDVTRAASPAASPADDDGWSAQVSAAISRLLGEAASLWGPLPIGLEEFARTVREGLAATRLGVAPHGLDQVTVGDIQRSRLEGIRFAIVGGLNDEQFPRVVADGPILNDHDRAVLSQIGLPLGPTAGEQQSEEAYLFYIAATRASERTLFTWRMSEEGGGELTNSLFVTEAQRTLGVERRDFVAFIPEALPIEALQASEEIVERLLLEDDLVLAEPLIESSALHESTAIAAAARESLAHLQPPWLDSELLPYLLRGDTLVASVSRLQQHAQCPFQGFASRLLRLEARPESEVTPLEIGSLVHSALERILAPRASLPRDLAAWSERLHATLERLTLEPRFLAFRADLASLHRLSRVERSLERFLRVEAERLNGSQFTIGEVEFAFGPRVGSPLVFPIDAERKLELEGRIDRVDIRTVGDVTHAMVIDYKLREKQGARRELESGVDLQLAAYLLYVRQKLEWTPAGGLYVPAQPTVRTEELGGDGGSKPEIKAHGFLIGDEAEAFDPEALIVPGKRATSQRLAGAAELDDLLSTGTEHLRHYAASWMKGWVEAKPFAPRGKLPCVNCEYAAVCRFRRGVDPTRQQAPEGMSDVPELESLS